MFTRHKSKSLVPKFYLIYIVLKTIKYSNSSTLEKQFRPPKSNYISFPPQIQCNQFPSVDGIRKLLKGHINIKYTPKYMWPFQQISADMQNWLTCTVSKHQATCVCNIVQLSYEDWSPDKNCKILAVNLQKYWSALKRLICIYVIQSHKPTESC